MNLNNSVKRFKTKVKSKKSKHKIYWQYLKNSKVETNNIEYVLQLYSVCITATAS